MDLIKQADKAFASTERSNQQTNWELIAEFMLPNQSGIFNGEDTPGGKKTRRLYDSTAIQANHDLSAAIHATLTNPATKWSKLRFKEDFLNNDPQALGWLQAVNKQIHIALNESNFDTMVSKNYQAFSSLGTMVLFQEEDKDQNNLFEGLKFEAVHLSQVAFSENHLGVVDQVYRKYRLTTRQIMEKWPDNLPDCIKDNPEDENKQHELYHIIKPRLKSKVREDSRLPKEMPYESKYILKKEQHLFEEGGYMEFPVFVTRWQTMPGEVYGRGPGHIGLPDVRTLNRVKELGLDAIDKAVNPPMLALRRGVLGNLDLRPGKINIVRNPEAVKEFITQTRFDVTQFAVGDLREAIRSVFFIDKLFLPPRTETGEMTAFEIDQRLAQMQRVLGPTLSRLNNEFLSPLILRTYKILARNGQLPELPGILQETGVDVEIGFINQLSRAQQIEELTTIDQYINRIAQAAQFKPEILDLMNADEYAKIAAKILGVPESLVTNDKEVQQIRQQRAEQAQQQQALEAGVAGADISSKLQ